MPEIWENKSTLPKVVAFDLDDTLWKGNVQWGLVTEGPNGKSTTPIKLDPEDHLSILDSTGRRIRLFDDSHAILKFLWDKKIPIAAASRSLEPDWCRKVLKLLPSPVEGKQLEEILAHCVIFEGNKEAHLRQIAEAFKINLNEILFFDNEERNMESAHSIGVPFGFCPNGINWKIFNSAMENFHIPISNGKVKDNLRHEGDENESKVQFL
eukprot:GHVP01060891.1.p1 GENE.GHVP01060891.1~~GHVP01060891.1.p1  ORF type:complete len:210 (+),score=49.52 GHVP01060891.1:184-813(+)